MLEDQAFETIAQCILDDLNDFANVSTGARRARGSTRSLLEQFQEERYDTSSNPNLAYVPKWTVQEAYNVVQKTKQVSQHNIQLIARRAAPRLQAIDEELELVSHKRPSSTRLGNHVWGLSLIVDK